MLFPTIPLPCRRRRTPSWASSWSTLASWSEPRCRPWPPRRPLRTRRHAGVHATPSLQFGQALAHVIPSMHSSQQASVESSDQGTVHGGSAVPPRWRSWRQLASSTARGHSHHKHFQSIARMRAAQLMRAAGALSAGKLHQALAPASFSPPICVHSIAMCMSILQAPQALCGKRGRRQPAARCTARRSSAWQPSRLRWR